MKALKIALQLDIVAFLAINKKDDLERQIDNVKDISFGKRTAV